MTLRRSKRNTTGTDGPTRNVKIRTTENGYTVEADTNGATSAKLARRAEPDKSQRGVFEDIVKKHVNKYCAILQDNDDTEQYKTNRDIEESRECEKTHRKEPTEPSNEQTNKAINKDNHEDSIFTSETSDTDESESHNEDSEWNSDSEEEEETESEEECSEDEHTETSWDEENENEEDDYTETSTDRTSGPSEQEKNWEAAKRMCYYVPV